MKSMVILIVFFILSLNASLFGQGQGAFSLFNTSRFARVIGLGNTYTGIAEGIEATYYNSAGLADIEYYGAIYSSGDGLPWFPYFVPENLELEVYDLAFASPLPKNLGTMTFSYNRFSLTDESGSSKNSIYRLHFARYILNGLSAGFSLNYYIAKTVSPGAEVFKGTGSAWDFSFSTLFRLNKIILPSLNDEFRFGVQLQNLIDSKVKYAQYQDEPKHQILRFGTSYSLLPLYAKISNLTPIKILIINSLAS